MEELGQVTSFFTLEDKAEVIFFANIQFDDSSSFPLAKKFENWFAETISQYVTQRQINLATETLLPLIKSTIIPVNLDHIYSTFHFQDGLLRALFFQSTGQMITKSLETEIYYQLAPGTSINSAVKLYSVNDAIVTQNIGLVRILRRSDDDSELSAVVEEIGRSLFEKIVITLKEFELDVKARGGLESSLMTEEKLDSIVKLFKLRKDEKDVTGAIVSKIAIKDHLN